MSSLIYNYGLFWREDHVFWGSSGKAGALLGVPSKKVTSPAVDFRYQTGIYVLYAEYDMIYVGQAGNGKASLFKRLKDHRRDHLASRWNRFSWFGLRQVIKGGALKAPKAAAHPSNNVLLNQMEAILLSAAEPPLNRQFGRWGRDGIPYLQVRDQALGPTLAEMISDLHAGKAP